MLRIDAFCCCKILQKTCVICCRREPVITVPSRLYLNANNTLTVLYPSGGDARSALLRLTVTPDRLDKDIVVQSTAVAGQLRASWCTERSRCFAIGTTAYLTFVPTERVDKYLLRLESLPSSQLLMRTINADVDVQYMELQTDRPHYTGSSTGTQRVQLLCINNIFVQCACVCCPSRAPAASTPAT